MAASIYIASLASELVRMGRTVECVEPAKGKIKFISNSGHRVSIHARWTRGGKLKITETSIPV